MHSLVINWLIKAVFPTPWLPSIPTLYDVITSAHDGDFTLCSALAKIGESNLDRLLKESPLFITPIKEQNFNFITYGLNAIGSRILVFITAETKKSVYEFVYLGKTTSILANLDIIYVNKLGRLIFVNVISFLIVIWVNWSLYSPIVAGYTFMRKMKQFFIRVIPWKIFHYMR